MQRRNFLKNTSAAGLAIPSFFGGKHFLSNEKNSLHIQTTLN
jgi:hypothetical protein